MNFFITLQYTIKQFIEVVRKFAIFRKNIGKEFKNFFRIDYEKVHYLKPPRLLLVWGSIRIISICLQSYGSSGERAVRIFKKDVSLNQCKPMVRKEIMNFFRIDYEKAHNL